MSNESFASRVDATTADDLRKIGGSKWTDAEILGAFIAEADFGLAPVIADALKSAIDEGAFGYAPKKYSDMIKVATANRLNTRHGWNITPENVLPIPDVLRALEVILTDFSRPDSKIIVPTPSYMPFLTIPPRFGREIIEVPMLLVDGVWKFDLDGIQQAFDDGGEVFLLCNPYNPLGRVFTREELLEVSEVVDRNRGRVFSDEIWAPLVFEGSTLVPYATINEVTAGHTITATSASKAFNLPGLKCAQLVTSNEADQAKIAAIGNFVGGSTSTLGMIANAVAFEQGDEWLGDTLTYLQGNRDELVSLVAEHLPGVTYIVPEGTYVAWLDFSGTGIDDPETFFRNNAGVGLTDGRKCGMVAEGCVRLIFATPRPILREMIAAMGKAMAAR